MRFICFFFNYRFIIFVHSYFLLFNSADCAAAGDVLVLTKPLGIMIAIQTYHWMNKSERWNRIKLVLNEDEVMKSYKRALECMKRLNNVGTFINCTFYMFRPQFFNSVQRIRIILNIHVTLVTLIIGLSTHQ